MLINAVLCVSNSDGTDFAISVVNFPVLPIGSEIDIYLSEDAWIENATIAEYRISNKRGVEISVNLCSRLGDESVNRQWEQVAVECVKDTSNLCELVYPVEIDFGVKFQLPIA
jgi:hypothetical protein